MICVIYQVNWFVYPELGSVINENATHPEFWSIWNIFRTPSEKYSDKSLGFSLCSLRLKATLDLIIL